MKINPITLSVLVLMAVMILAIMMQQTMRSRPVSSPRGDGKRPADVGFSFFREKASALSTRGGPAATGWKTLMAVETGDDAQAAREFIDTWARDPRERRRMEKESAYVRRWELIEPRVSFQEIGERLLAGENIEHFVIPGLRGERIAIKITKANVRSAERGTILGHIEGQPSSYVALTFVNGKQTGVVQMRGQKTHEIAYTPYGAGRIIIKEVDLVARARKTEMQMAAYHFSYSCTDCKDCKDTSAPRWE